MDFFHSIFTYFTSNQNKLSHKTVVVILSIFGILIIDNTLNFSYHYNHVRKLEQIEIINKIIADSSITNSERNDLINTRKHLINTKTWKDKAYEYIFSINFNNIDSNKIFYDPIKPPIDKTDTKQSNNDSNNTKSERSYWIHFITSSWIIMLMNIFFIIMIPYAIFTNGTKELFSLLLGLLASSLVLNFIAWMFAKMFSYIPLLNNNVINNYILNAIIHLIIMGGFAYLANRFKKK